MENNKLLIGVQFTYSADSNNPRTGEPKSVIKQHSVELYVLRDITLQQLLDGIGYGLMKRAASDSEYQRCHEVYERCVSEFKDDNGRQYFSQIRLGSLHQETVKDAVNDSGENLILQKEVQTKTGKFTELYLYRDSCSKPLNKLGFINSSRLVFSDINARIRIPDIDMKSLVSAFAPPGDDTKDAEVNIGRKITFPEYNISTRLLYKFDDTPVEIIPPQDPPKRPTQSLFSMLLPSLLTLLVMLVGRTFIMGMFSGNAMSGLQMALFSGLMSTIAVITTVLTWRRQRREYRTDLSNWRVRYEDYVNDLMAGIRKRQSDDVKKMKELYPDAEDLMRPSEEAGSLIANSVYSLNRGIYSRAPMDEDYLTFRVGLSDDVESYFAVKGEEKDAVFSEAFFIIRPLDRTIGVKETDTLQLYLGSENLPKDGKVTNISRLTGVVSKRFQFMEDAPLLYSLKNIGAIGVVDREADSPSGLPCAANYFVDRMVFELCYYHSPENLQFVVFFPEKRSTDEIEHLITPYKFMPHFRELFQDRSQFVFDDQSAGLVLSGLLNMMNSRQLSGSEATPHIVLIIYHEYSLREHAFAEFLPKAPDPAKGFENTLGLTFVYVTNFREYLPHYCDSVFQFERHFVADAGTWHDCMTVTPRNNIAEKKEFRFPDWTAARGQGSRKILDFWTKEIVRSGQAFQFLSAVYYTRIAENGKVPSVVSLFDLLPDEGENLIETIQANWGLSGQSRKPDITKSLSVPIGKTDTDIAYLDLHEKGDGPHMLVAGTTGSGKTETIITYLLELCVTFRPDELNLLLVDMKGGGFTKRIGQLPHVVGAVTDVDGDENGTGAEYMLHRFLDAMRSEIKRRKILYNQLHVDNIDDYIRACQNIENFISDKKDLTAEDIESIRRTSQESPLSHIMLVVDEFTELKQFTRENDELDFMGEITKIARIGRSLGFHILLISQNIEGAITDDIRVNSNARLCLKVATRQASREMIGTDVAFSPSMPGHGRAYLKVLTRENLSYFQSGYSAASVSKDEELPFEITLASKYGAYQSFFNSKEKEEYDREQAKKNGIVKEEHKEKQISAVVKAICSVHDAHRESDDSVHVPYHEAHIVFHPPLPNRVAYKNGELLDLSRQDGESLVIIRQTDERDHTFELPIGLYDNPLEQKQPVFYLDLYHSNTAVFGVSMSGKTTFIKTLLFRLHDNRLSHPDEIIYILDFSGSLSSNSYRDMPSVCACFGSSNEEDVKRVFHEIERHMEDNSKALQGQSYGSKLDDEPTGCPPHMTLIIENLNAFLSNDRYAIYQDQLLQFCRDGLSKGLSVIFTASDTAGIGRFSTSFQRKIAFEMPTDSYYDIFGRKVNPPMRVSGRGIVTLESTEYEFQCFDPFSGEKGPQREAEEKELLANLSSETLKSTDERRLKAFGDILTAEECEKEVGELAAHGKICVGLDYERHLPVFIDIRETHSIAIYGRRHFGKTNLLRILLDGILKLHPDAHFVFLDGGKGQLTKVQLPEFYKAVPYPRYIINDLGKFWDYLYEAGYCREDSGAHRKSAKESTVQEWAGEANTMPFTVFVLQCRKLFQNSSAARYLIGKWLPEAVSDAEDKNYLFIFTDVKPITGDTDVAPIFTNSISAAFLLDNIGEFVRDKGARSVFGEMDAKELKSKYARCSLGDGYYYDMEDETKLKFIHYGGDKQPET